MIRVTQIKIEVEKDSPSFLLETIAKKLKIKKEDILSYKIQKKSLDARKKPNLYFYYEVDIELKEKIKILKSKTVFKAPKEEYKFTPQGIKKLNHRPIIVGAGPAGLFCAYLLSEYGYNPLIIERGEKIEERVKTVEDFWKNNNLKLNSNVQFGEGGAGTFSDGKLNTMVKDKRFVQKKIFEIFIENGAPEEIMYDYKPHIGTDVLRELIKNMRNKIIEMGGKFRFNTCLTNIIYENNQIKAIEINNEEKVETDVLVLALGHSARDTFEMLYDKKIKMEAKPFAVGVRIEHLQEQINEAQLGKKDIPNIGAANYKLTYKATNGRGVYTFCMCPGGYVINASSEENKLAINGMSNYKRDTKNANSAVIVTISPDDFGTHPLDGINYQRILEEKTYKIGSGKIPVQLYKDFKEKRVSTKYGEVQSITKGQSTFADLNTIFEPEICTSLQEAIEHFGTKIKCFNNDDAILSAVESRTSSPVRITRNEQLESNISGIYPCGEGAGYAGGITSAAIDGVKVFEQIACKYKN